MNAVLPEGFFDALEARHLAELTFTEVRKGLQALSSLYVERRDRISRGAALDGAGKRAAFALYYGPQHLLSVREIARRLELKLAQPLVVDLGCGTLAAAAGLALAAREAGQPAEVLGVEKNGWAAGEARFTMTALGLRGRILRQDIESFVLPERVGAVVAAYTINELSEPTRLRWRGRLLAAADAGACVLVVEPLSRKSSPWWPEWKAAVLERGGREDEWRLAWSPPERMRLLAKAAGLIPRELLARSLCFGS